MRTCKPSNHIQENIWITKNVECLGEAKLCTLHLVMFSQKNSNTIETYDTTLPFPEEKWKEIFLSVEIKNFQISFPWTFAEK